MLRDAGVMLSIQYRKGCNTDSGSYRNEYTECQKTLNTP